MTIELEQAVASFFDLANALKGQVDVDAEAVLSAMMNFYTDDGVQNAEGTNDDMMLLQWGSMRFLVGDDPVDYRSARRDPEFDAVETRYLDITRQVVPRLDPEDEFDDVALHLSITLGFESGGPRGRSQALWIEDRSVIEPVLTEFRADDDVAVLLPRRPERFQTTVGPCG